MLEGIIIIFVVGAILKGILYAIATPINESLTNRENDNKVNASMSVYLSKKNQVNIPNEEKIVWNGYTHIYEYMWRTADNLYFFPTPPNRNTINSDTYRHPENIMLRTIHRNDIQTIYPMGDFTVVKRIDGTQLFYDVASYRFFEALIPEKCLGNI